MFSTRHIFIAVSMATLAACSSTTATVGTPPTFTPSISGTAQKDARGLYSVTQNGVTRTLGSGHAIASRQIQYINAPASFSYVYDSAAVTAVGGMDRTAPNTNYAGISGTRSATVPTSGTGTYHGDFGVTYYNSVTNKPNGTYGAFTTNVDFSAGTLSGSGTGVNSSQLTVSGTLQGAQFNGTANFSVTTFTGNGTNVPMTGGFYGAGNTVAGIVQNADIAGVFWGQ
jgi:hypothetical protein